MWTEYPILNQLETFDQMNTSNIHTSIKLAKLQVNNIYRTNRGLH